MARRRARTPVLLWFVAAAASGLIETCEESRQSHRDMRALVPAPDSVGAFPFRHRWSESREAPHPRLREQTVDTTLAYADLRQMTTSFGVPETWTTLRAFNWVERAGRREERRRQAELIRRAAERGVSISFEDNVIASGPDYEWILEKSRDDVRSVAKQLSEAYRKSGLDTERGFHRVVASFVQSIEYAIPEPSRRDANGEEIWTFGIATPIEVLYNKWGDCDSKCLLFASLLRSFRGHHVIFLVGNDHMFAGVRTIPRRGDRYVQLGGVRYVLIELTDSWPLGRIPRDMWRGVGRNEYRVFRV